MKTGVCHCPRLFLSGQGCERTAMEGVDIIGRGRGSGGEGEEGSGGEGEEGLRGKGKEGWRETTLDSDV